MPQTLQRVPQTRKNIQVSCSSDISFVRREAKQYEGELDLTAGMSPKSIPTAQSTSKARTTINQRLRFPSSSLNSSKNKWFSCAINLRDGDLHSSLNRVQSRLGSTPRFNRLHIKANCRSIREIQFTQEFRCCLAVIHCRTANKAEACERDDLGNTRRWPLAFGLRPLYEEFS